MFLLIVKKTIVQILFFLSKLKHKNLYLFKIKIKNVVKTFLIPNELSNYKENILASLSIIVNYFNFEKLKKDLFLGFRIPQSRGSLMSLRKGGKKINILDESYNSNPLSLKFALDRFDSIKTKRNKKFLLIGNMLELGKYSKKLHIKIADYINNSKVFKTFVYGNHTVHTFNKLKPRMRGRILNNNMDIHKLINTDLPNDSFLMIKGSNSTGLNKIIQKL